MAELITLATDYGYEDYRLSGVTSTTIEASAAHWIVSNMGTDTNLYPILISNSQGVTLLGGTISGEVPLDIDRVDAYINSATIFLRDADNSRIENWTITGGAWDGIRIRASDDFVINHVWMSDVRDDAIENDDGMSGTVSNSLFDGVFVGISTADANSTNQSGNVVTIDNVLMRMQNYLDHGIMTHQSPFKVTSNSPSMKIHNSIIAIENVDHIGQARLAEAWRKVIEASGNYFLNLSDEPLPSDYPMPPSGFTVLQGEEARIFWEAARTDWIAEFNGEAATDVTPPAGDGGSPDSGGTTSPTDSEPTLPVDTQDHGAIDAGSVVVELWDALTDTKITTLTPGGTIGANLLNNPDVALVVAAAPGSVLEGTIGSVTLDFENGLYQRVENAAPYALFGDTSGDLSAPASPLFTDFGTYNLQLSFHGSTDGGGVNLGELAFQMNVESPTSTLTAPSTSTLTAPSTSTPTATPTAPETSNDAAVIDGLQIEFWDAASDQKIAGFTSGSSVDQSLFDAFDVTIVATPTQGGEFDGVTGSIRFSLDGAKGRIEKVEPYALFGDSGGDLRGGHLSLDPGIHQLDVDLFSGRNANGDLLASFSVSFEVTDAGLTSSYDMSLI